MRFGTKRTLSVWLLLSVFVPMLLLSSLHVHSDIKNTVEENCEACVEHIPHSSHLSLQPVHSANCVLCQFASLPFVVAALLFFRGAPPVYATLFVAQAFPCLVGISLSCQSRAPPVV